MLTAMKVVKEALKVWNEAADITLSSDDIVDHIEYGRGVFEALVLAADAKLDPASETGILSAALDRAPEIDRAISRDGITEEVKEEIKWWAKAYSAVALAEDIDDEDIVYYIYERIFCGDAEEALKLARSAVKE